MGASARVSLATALLATCLSALGGCHPPSRTEDPHQDPAFYDAADHWLCRPDLPGDACHGDLDATELLPDGSRARVPFVPAADPQVDCFYIYPTVDLGLRAGNHTDLEHTDKMRDVAQAQIARYRSVCDVYAPLYRQITIGTYVFSSEAERQVFSDVAYADITAAFKNYLAHHDRGRKLVIIGHSQGAQLATRLLHDTFDHNDALRARLLVGMPIGFDANTPDGQRLGGSFDHLPPCATDAETGCIVSYRSVAAGDTPTNAFKLPPHRRAICVNPAGAGRAGTPLTSVGLSRRLRDLHVDTPYVIERGFYQARCAPDPNGHDFLEIGEAHAPGDRRAPLVDLGKFHGGLGLHVLDMSLAQGDLIALIATKLAASQGAASTASGSYELRVPSPDGGAEVALVAVTADGHVRLFPGSPLEHQAGLDGPAYTFTLHDRRVTDGTGKEEVACRDHQIWQRGAAVGELVAGGFRVGDTTVTLGPGGQGQVVHGHAAPEPARFVGVAPSDPCTAALLWLMIPVPRAG